jgi:hypothetical protein
MFEMPSDTINANLGEAQRTLAAAKKKIVTFAVEVHEQLKHILNNKRARDSQLHMSQSVGTPSKGYLSNDAIKICKEKMSNALEAVYCLKKELQRRIVMESRSKVSVKLEYLSTYENQLAEIMNSNNQVEEYMQKMLQSKPGAASQEFRQSGHSQPGQRQSFVIDHVQRQKYLLQELEKLKQEENRLEEENSRIASDLLKSEKVVNRDLKTKLKKLSKSQKPQSDQEYDDLRELRELLTPGHAKATTAMTQSQLKTFFKHWSEKQKFDFLRKVSLEEFALLIKHEIIRPPSMLSSRGNVEDF